MNTSMVLHGLEGLKNLFQFLKSIPSGWIPNSSLYVTKKKLSYNVSIIIKLINK